MGRGNGVTTSYSFDPAGRLKAIAHGSVGTDLFDYDAAGQRVKRTTPFAQALTTTASTTTVDDANRILTRDSVTYTHDDNGNRTGDGTNTYVWDSRNRLTSMTTPSGTFTFTYDPAGNLIRQTSPAGTQEFVLDDLTNIAYTNGTSFLTARGIDSHLAAIASGSPTYALTDAINSTAATTDATGAVLTRYIYEPYGQTTSTGPGSCLFRYTGRVPVVGNIYHYRARFYDAVAQRFLSEDPLGLNSGTNFYGYNTNNPISYLDPLGLAPVRCTSEKRRFFDWLDKPCGKLAKDLGTTKRFILTLAAKEAGWHKLDPDHNQPLNNPFGVNRIRRGRTVGNVKYPSLDAAIEDWTRMYGECEREEDT
jgi:RHS repeat-associated protein